MVNKSQRQSPKLVAIGKQDKAKLGSNVKSLKANTLCAENQALIHKEQKRIFYLQEESSKTAESTRIHGIVCI